MKKIYFILINIVFSGMVILYTDMKVILHINS